MSATIANAAIPGARIAARSLAAQHPVHQRMQRDFLHVGLGATVADAIEAVRRSKLGNTHASYVFVTRLGGVYEGFVRVSALLRSDAATPIESLIEGHDLAVKASTDQETAARRLQTRDVALLPIVNDQNVLIGVLTFDDAMDILESEASEDIYKKAGIADMIHLREVTRSEKLTGGGILYPVQVRILFLMVTLAGGLAVGGLIDTFEEVLSAVIALAIFIPLIMDMGGNVGTQSTTIFARGLALGHINLDRFWRKHLAREALIGVTMAAALATIAGTVAYVWQGLPNDLPQLGFVVGGALFFAVTTGAVLGFLLPYAMLKIGVDHAPGADPFITTIKDFSGLAVYFLLAMWLLGITTD
jgi:magnesium transporter